MLHAESPVDIHCDRHWGTRPRKNSEIHIDVSHSRQPLVKGERLVRYEVNTVMSDLMGAMAYRLGKLTTRATHSANKLARRLRTRRRHARRRSMGEAQHEGTTDVQCVCVCCLVLSCVVLCCLVLSCLEAIIDPKVFGCAAPDNVPGQGNTRERLSKLETASPP